MRGYDVLHPMGWDAFGLPAEQHAIETGQHPAGTTASNIATFKRQLKMLGFSYDWSREIDTTDPGYVRWTQWIFLQLFRRGLAYQATVPVNWCPALGTVLANEEVVDGTSERGGHPVYRTPLRRQRLLACPTPKKATSSASSARGRRHAQNVGSMTKARSRGKDELRRSYKRSDFPAGFIRGKYAARLAAGSNVVVLSAENAAAVPTSDAVNEALNGLVRVAKAARLTSRSSGRRSR